MDKESNNAYDIEKQIYNTQWVNIRYHWDETSKAIRYLSTLVIIAIWPIKYLKVTIGGSVTIDGSSEPIVYLKVFMITIIIFLGFLTFLNQYNHYKRSKEARKVIVEIEKKWNLYDGEHNFVYQDSPTKYCYSMFAGREKRLSHSVIQFIYIVLITVIGVGFVSFV